MGKTVIQIGENKIVIDGSAAFITQMQSIVIGALGESPIGSAAIRGGRKKKAAAKRAGKKRIAKRKKAAKKKAVKRGKRRGGRPKDSKVIGGKLYTAAQIRKSPALKKKLAKK